VRAAIGDLPARRRRGQDRRFTSQTLARRAIALARCRTNDVVSAGETIAQIDDAYDRAWACTDMADFSDRPAMPPAPGKFGARRRRKPPKVHDHRRRWRAYKRIAESQAKARG